MVVYRSALFLSDEGPMFETFGLRFLYRQYTNFLFFPSFLLFDWLRYVYTLRLIGPISYLGACYIRIRR